MQGLKIDLDSALPKLFAHLVEVNEQEIATRRRAPQVLLQGDLKTVAEALTEARLLVTSEGENYQPMIEVAHETVLSGWDRLRQWILDHAVKLRTRRDLEQVAKEWHKSGRPGSALRTGILLKNYLNTAEPRSEVAKDYLAACKRRRNWLRAGYALFVVLLLAGSRILFHLKDTKYPPAFATQALWVQLGMQSVPLPKMVKIPEGSFVMDDLSGQTNEQSVLVHRVEFLKPFEMGQFEVTFSEYDLFAATTGRAKPDDGDWGRGDKPVINVSWDDAVDYALWLSERTGLKYRLPSEAEWEYAARATTTSERYWPEKTENDKDDPACKYANVYDRNNEAKIKQSGYIPSGETFACDDAFPFTASTLESATKLTPNKWQLFNMLGNVWEWTQDCYVGSYKDTPTDGSAQESPDNNICPFRVLRGGSWGDGPQLVRSADRLMSTPGNRGTDSGFRLARTL